MDKEFLLECYEEKETRLKKLNEIHVEAMLLKKQINKLDKQTRELIDMDPDYNRYNEQCKRDGEYMGTLDYEKYCAYIKLLFESPPESELYSKIYGLLKINTYIPEAIKSTFDRELWEQILGALSIRMSDMDFNTWIRKIYPVSCEESLMKLSVDNEICRYIIKDKFEPIILSAIKEVTGNDYRIEYITDSYK